MDATDMTSLPEMDYPAGNLKALLMRDLFMLPIGSIACLLLTVWLSKVLSIPSEYAKAGGLLQQSAWPIAMATAWIAIIAGAILASIVAGHIHYDGGLFCACIGLAGLSIRMGPTRYALFLSPRSSVFLGFAAEIVLLFVAVALAWLILRQFAGSWLASESESEVGTTTEPLDQNLLACAAQIIVMIILMMILCQSDRKPQTLAAVGISAYVSTLAAHYMVATRPSVWFWIGPLIVGLVGYLGQYMNPNGISIGDIEGLFAPLARAVPLDYASLGVAGALLGYWTSHRWHREREAMERGA